jgi:hypothetical protein
MNIVELNGNPLNGDLNRVRLPGVIVKEKEQPKVDRLQNFEGPD